MRALWWLPQDPLPRLRVRDAGNLEPASLASGPNSTTKGGPVGLSSEGAGAATEGPVSFGPVAEYYDSIMRGVDYRAWVQHLDHLFARCGVRPASILDLACGTGNMSEMLVRRGMRVVGVDLSPGMIAAARAKEDRRRLGVKYLVQDAAELDLPGEQFDACVCLFDSLNYVIHLDRVRMVFAGVYRHLRPGGCFVFDINSRFALENHFFDQRNDETDDRVRYVWRSEFDPGTKLCEVKMRFFVQGAHGVDDEFRETHVQYAFDDDELQPLLAEAGFVGVETFHSYTLRPVRSTTDRIFFLAQRPGDTEAAQ